MGLVELEYAGREGRGRRVVRAVRRWGWVGVIVLVVGVGWWFRVEWWRKGLVLWWQGRLAEGVLPAGTVVYEGRVAEAGRMVAGHSDAVTDWGGKAYRLAGVWRGFPWGLVGAGAETPGTSKGVVYAGELVRRSDGATRRVVVALHVVTSWYPWDGTSADGRGDMVWLEVYWYEPEGVRRRGALGRGWPRGVDGVLSGRVGMPAGYRVLAGRAVGDGSMFEVECRAGAEVFLVRGTWVAGEGVEWRVWDERGRVRERM